MSCHDCVNRREFLAKAALAAAAIAALDACGDGQIGPTAVVSSGGDRDKPAPVTGGVVVKLADFPGLATVGTLVEIPQRFRAVMRTGASSFVALSMICTHEGCVAEVESNAFHCHCHDSRFKSDGTVTNGPATRPLAKLNVAFDATTNTLTIE